MAAIAHNSGIAADAAHQFEVGVATSAAGGSMGLTGLFKQLGNASAMVVICVCLFLTGGAAWMMHREAMATMERMNKDNVASMTKVIERNTVAIDSLAREIRALRTGGFGPDE